MFSDFECPWYVFDYSLRSLLGACILLFGVCGFLLNIWLFITFIHSHLLSFKSHILILNLCCASLGRNVLGGFPFIGTSALANKWLFGDSSCELFAFMNTFHGVYQMMALSVLCLERYWSVKYYKMGKDLPLRWYVMVTAVGWASAAALATAPLAGAGGGYACDVARVACGLRWRLADALPLTLVGGLVPIIIIITSLWKSIILEKYLYNSEQHREQRSLTKTVALVSCMTLVLWCPQAVLGAWQALAWSRPFYPQPPQVLAMLAPIAAEAATSVPVLCYLAANPRLRIALLGRVKRNYGIIKNKPRKTLEFQHEYKSVL